MATAMQHNTMEHSVQVLDYIFHSADLSTVSVLEIPAAEEIGPGRLPSTQFCSDHLSLLADISLDTTQHM